MQRNEPSSPEFKYLQPLPAAKTLKRDRSSPERAQSPVKFISDPHNYPRKRASIACEICRVRKTRCDGAKPSCVSCVKLGVVCSYAKLASGNRPEQDAAGIFLSKIDTRLDRIDARLDQIEALLDQKDYLRLNSHHRAASPKAPSTCAPDTRATGPTPDARTASVSYPTPSSPRLSAAPQSSSPSFIGYTQIGLSFDFLSHLGGHEVPQILSPLRFDETEAYLEREIGQGSQLLQAVNPSWSALDLSPSVRWRLQQWFANTVLEWFPIFDHDTFSKWAAQSYNQNFDQQNQHTLETSLTLFILALGALSKDECIATNDLTQCPGINYFLVACKILNQRPVPTYSIIETQCRILMSLYFLLCLRPLQASHSISQASRAVLTLLNCRNRLANDAQLRESCHRAYWVCFIIEYELFTHVIYTSQSLLNVHEPIPLPISHYNEPGMFWFLSEISMRQLYIYALECVWKEPGISYEPMVTAILQQQVLKWYDNLHPNIKFPEDLTPLLEPQKAFLRSQYFSLRWFIHWPAVVRILTKEPDDEDQHAELLKSSREAIHYLILHIFSAETLMQQRQQMLFANLIATYYSTMLLSCIHTAPCFETIQNRQTHAAIRKGHEMLSLWAENPGIANTVRHIEQQMVRQGLMEPKDHAASPAYNPGIYFTAGAALAPLAPLAPMDLQGAPAGAGGKAPGLGHGVSLEHAQLARTRMGLEMVMERVGGSESANGARNVGAAGIQRTGGGYGGG